MSYRRIITIEPDKRGDKPCIRGLRIMVDDILDYLAAGMTANDIITDFPDRTVEDIRAALTFAADRERRLFSVAARNGSTSAPILRLRLQFALARISVGSSRTEHR